MRAGKLRHRLTLQRPQGPADGGGGFSFSWISIDEIWGNVTPLTASETLTFGRSHHAVTHKVTIRYRPDIAAHMRFMHRNRALEITSIKNPDETSIWIECQCVERPQ